MHETSVTGPVAQVEPRPGVKDPPIGDPHRDGNGARLRTIATPRSPTTPAATTVFIALISAPPSLGSCTSQHRRPPLHSSASMHTPPHRAFTTTRALVSRTNTRSPSRIVVRVRAAAVSIYNGLSTLAAAAGLGYAAIHATAYTSARPRLARPFATLRCTNGVERPSSSSPG